MRCFWFSIFSLFFLLSMGSAFGEENPKESGKTSLKKLRTIVLDPGHGGENTGCIGPHKVYEKVVTLQVALAIEKELNKQLDSKVVLTRRSDVYIGLRERTRMATDQGADVFISIHMNASATGRGKGIETFFLSTGSSSAEVRALVQREQEDYPIDTPAKDVSKGDLDNVLYDLKLRAAHSLSEKLAARVQRAMLLQTKGDNRGVKQAPFAVLKEAEVPAIVLECGFLTNKREAEDLLKPDYQERIAKAVALALIRFDQDVSEESAR